MQLLHLCGLVQAAAAVAALTAETAHTPSAVVAVDGAAVACV